jgi:hypothetical protein
MVAIRVVDSIHRWSEIYKIDFFKNTLTSETEALRIFLSRYLITFS